MISLVHDASLAGVDTCQCPLGARWPRWAEDTPLRDPSVSSRVLISAPLQLAFPSCGDFRPGHGLELVEEPASWIEGRATDPPTAPPLFSTADIPF